MKLLFALLLFVYSFTANAGTISTEMYCDETATIIKGLRQTYEESPIIVGRATDGAKSVMTFWINPDTKTWSIVATKDNVSCIVGVGENFEVLSFGKKDKTIKYH